jgi:hypothetical protein
MDELIKIASNGQWTLEKAIPPTIKKPGEVARSLAKPATAAAPAKSPAATPAKKLKETTVKDSDKTRALTQAALAATPSDITKPMKRKEAPTGQHPKELMPPQEMTRETESGAPIMRERQGTFHGEGARTRGKVVPKRVGYLDKKTGQMMGHTIHQQETHHWRWDHNNKKWEHVKTTFGSTSD